jgi:pyruvate decarboxylase
MVSEPVDAKRLSTPLDLNPPRDPNVENDVVEKILEAIYSSKNPMILVDVLTARFHCTPLVRQLVDVTQFPVFLIPGLANASSHSPQIWERGS